MFGRYQVRPEMGLRRVAPSVFRLTRQEEVYTRQPFVAPSASASATLESAAAGKDPRSNGAKF